jgi:hypothetical protein
MLIMKSCAKWWQVITGLAVAIVAVSATVQAIRQGSWGPIGEVCWLPAVIVGIWPGTYRRCLPRRKRAGQVS